MIFQRILPLFDSDTKLPSLVEELQDPELKEEKSIPYNEIEDIFYSQNSKIYENLPEYFEFLRKLDQQLEKDYKNQFERISEKSLDQSNIELAINIILLNKKK